MVRASASRPIRSAYSLPIRPAYFCHQPRSFTRRASSAREARYAVSSTPYSFRSFRRSGAVIPDWRVSIREIRDGCQPSFLAASVVDRPD